MRSKQGKRLTFHLKINFKKKCKKDEKLLEINWIKILKKDIKRIKQFYMDLINLDKDFPKNLINMKEIGQTIHIIQIKNLGITKEVG